MAQRPKPGGYTTVSPYLIVDGADGTISFLANVLGAVELRRFAAPDGKLMHAEVRIDDSVVMLADSTAEWPPIPANVHVYVPDVDATYRRALAAGAISVQEPVQKGDEDKRGGVRDAGGTTWWIATRMGRVADPPPRRPTP
ncbi:MAG TPA: VOC family protein [Gemmatimonadota bacterium]|nr:VOC family protein [Gemmatimonadota bacterium]